MTPTLIGLIALLTGILGYTLACIWYVYKIRGRERFGSFSEYVRKGWPMFAPINCFLYMCTERRARVAIMDNSKFPEFDIIKEHWETIRAEGLALYQSKQLEAAKDQSSPAYYDVGFRSFYKYGWSKFYLKWYGYSHASGQRLCPKTSAILAQIPQVNGAMFSLLPAGSQLTCHLDPVASSLRYHLGLATPNDDKCWINIDGTVYSWRDGVPLIFDETYPHFARNDTETYRLILMCDVRRPMNIIGRMFNGIIKFLLRMSIVPNTDEDRRGLGNKIFAGVAPMLAKLKALKQTNWLLYKTIKHGINLTLILLVFAAIGGAYWGVASLIQQLSA